MTRALFSCDQIVAWKSETFDVREHALRSILEQFNNLVLPLIPLTKISKLSSSFIMSYKDHGIMLMLPNNGR